MDIKLKGENRTYYNVLHYTDTIKSPIRFWSNYINKETETDSYQEKIFFELIHDKEEKEVYIIANKSIVDQFLKRIEERKIIELKRYEFNLNLINIKEILNTYGLWNKVEKKNIKCEAQFGSNLTPSKVEGSLIAINMKICINNKEGDTTISKMGQISTHSGKLNIDDIIDFYKKIKSELMPK